MKRNNLSFFMMAILLVVATCIGTSCSKSNEPEVPQGPKLDNLEEISLVKENIGAWDEAYVTPVGYFLYSENIENLKEKSSIKKNKMMKSSAAEEDDAREFMTFLSADGKVKVSFVISPIDKMPLQIVIDDNTTIDFCYLNDNVLEIVVENASGMSLMKTVEYNRPELLARALELGYTNNLQHALYVLISLAKNNVTGVPQLESLIELFEQLLAMSINNDTSVEDLTEIDVEIDMNTGLWNFVVDSETWTTEVVQNVYFSISLWTGDAKFKLGGSSVTLGGAVYCASNSYNTLGTYGILVDTDRNNLTIDKAEFNVQGHQDPLDLSFEVDFRGFKPTTTYYYRAYYMFNSTDHGALRFKYGDPNAQIGYDNTIKSFTTDENYLTVDVVMCMDVTGSMGDEISMVKNNALTFYEQFKSRCDENNIILTGLTTQVIQYQDINVDGERALMQSPTYRLPDEQEEFQTYVNGIYADWGGDIPESGLEALDLAFSKSDWGADDGYHRQVVILWTDADFLSGEGYTSLTIEGVKAKWDAMPSGRRMILFAPNGNCQPYSSGWENMDSWTNVVHITDITRGFNDMGSVLDDIINELTGRGTTYLPKPKRAPAKTHFQPNR